ncbi:DUF3541 domain-containing protein [uncultured Photobacterium sp.]|uniref:DUF3541 domain-containing protein n=1 Tax=uncultured Photobacterium sp. TaxID=173973 RepID=UPI00262A58FB|nr:DUF3541 domain-containing protein [uncultured Photobacterium sp.]
MKSLQIGFPLIVSLLVSPVFAETASVSANQASELSSYQQDAELIRQTYESQLFTLPAFKVGHYGLRMYRQTQDAKYESAIWADMARVASRLNKFATEVYTPEQIKAYSNIRIQNYSKKTDERSKLRYAVTKSKPEYLYLGVDLLGSMARANEYGLKHREDVRLRQVIRRYDFTDYATDPDMIRAWAAQVANQVYWLRQLGEQDVVDEFIEAFRATYPDKLDKSLSDQQFMNKIYGLTHIIFAASEYYQHPLKEQDFKWIYDYYRDNIDTILSRAKEDVIAEVGINFLLAGLDTDPVVENTRKVIQQAIDRKAGMVPSVHGETELIGGEHRNVLSIMLLDWRGAKAVPTVSNQPHIFDAVPYGLIAK